MNSDNYQFKRITAWAGVALVSLVAATALQASENAARRPFAKWAEVPARGELLAGIVYEESEAYHIWAKRERIDINQKSDNGQNYGIDVNQGYIALDYGLTEKWAADLNIGGTTAGWRSFAPVGEVQSTTGMMDTTFGVRYQIVHETNASSAWMPTFTFRAGAILPGSYDKDFPFAPGNHSAVIEPSILFRKHFGWDGFGTFGDVLYRWMRSNGNDQYITSIGFFQQVQRWEIDVGYRHLQALSGSNISIGPNQEIYYRLDVREISDSIDAGFSYTTSKRKLRYAFHARKTFDGSNTDSKFWVGGSIDIPFALLGK